MKINKDILTEYLRQKYECLDCNHEGYVDELEKQIGFERFECPVCSAKKKEEEER